jgi:hypothetical protein
MAGRSTQLVRRRNSVGQKLRWLLLATYALAVPGCGSNSSAVAHLQGKVTLYGKQIPDDATAFVVFAADGKAANAVSVPIAKGRYDSSNIPKGAIKVFFEITRPLGPMKKSDHTGQPYQEIASLVPAKYATGIPLEVTGDDPNRDFQLTN